MSTSNSFPEICKSKKRSSVSVVDFSLLQSLIRVTQTRQQVREQGTERGNRHGARQEQPPMGVRVRWDEEKLLLRGQWNGTTTKKKSTQAPELNDHSCFHGKGRNGAHI